MLKNIRLHIEENEEKQYEIEEIASHRIKQRLTANVNAFQRYIPSLAALLTDTDSRNISLFCNKYGQFNIVDYGLGRAFYGFSPQQEVDAQVHFFQQNCEYLDLSSNTKDGHDKSIGVLPKEIPLLVVFGLGLGWHLEKLINEHSINHLLIYEPEPQYFSCSGMVLDWRELLKLSQKKNTNLYIQLGKDGRDILSDIAELKSHFTVPEAYFYQHYHHPVFDSIMQQIRDENWQGIQSKGLNFNVLSRSADYLPVWSQPIDVNTLSFPKLPDERLQKNLDAFKHYFPEIYKEFVDYQVADWIPAKNASGEINILHRDSATNWYGDSPKREAEELYQAFSSQPNKDGLILGYEGQKLKHYLHYQFVKLTQNILGDLQEEKGVLPENIKSLIMFGLGSGYQLEHVLTHHKIEKIFICEPNRDFFYASLFAIDWLAILQGVDESGGRIYINIGDDGTNLFRDLLNQFYSIGPYILNSTFFFQGYYNARLNDSIAQLREQLQIVISMGEYFDHAKYGIAHTWAGIEKGYKHLIKNPERTFSYVDKNVPVFIVGNGPSLDSSIADIKDCYEQAIVISCGTSLQALYKKGIQPDFHAEIEQNRATYDWACRIDDPDYLKGISLLSCNGIHPDTAALYKTVLLAFKEGESSTVSTLKILGGSNFEVLKFSFPTVTNFVLNIVLKMGFEQIYLFGTDLGFVDDKKHHSMYSGYYEGGQQLYDYTSSANTALRVPGNFRQEVSTKQEFKIARMIMEQSLREYPQVDCFNTSDGALINGTKPLRVNDLLVLSTSDEKQQCIKSWHQSAFVEVDFESFTQAKDKTFNNASLARGFDKILQLVDQALKHEIDLEELIEEQKNVLFDSYQNEPSLLFYYLYGTLNYANAVMVRLDNLQSASGGMTDASKEALVEWKKSLEKIKIKCLGYQCEFDFSEAFGLLRAHSNLKRLANNKQVFVYSEDEFVIRHLKVVASRFGGKLNVINGQLEREVGSCDLFIIFLKNSENMREKIKGLLGSVDYSLAICGGFFTVPVKEMVDIANQYTNFSMVQGFADSRQVNHLYDGKILLNTAEGLAYSLFSFGFSVELYTCFIPKLRLLDLNDFNIGEKLADCYFSFGDDREVLQHTMYFSLPREKVNYVDGLCNRAVISVGSPSVNECVIARYETTDSLRFLQDVDKEKPFEDLSVKAWLDFNRANNV